jgi:hypothetical protein
METTELSYEPELRYAIFDAVGALEDSRDSRAAGVVDDFTMTVGRKTLTSNNRRINAWMAMHKGGLIASETITTAEYELIEERLGLGKGTLFAVLRSANEQGTATEHPWQPEARYASMAKLHKEPRGSKSVEHLEILRTSNPDYGSLVPSLDRPSKQEVSYDPLKRYVALAPSLRVPRGSKSVEHLEILRTSNPDYGSLYPRRLVVSKIALASLTMPLSSLRRNESTNSFVCDEDDDVAELPASDSWEARLALGRAWRMARASDEGYSGADGEERDSERSAARTLERISVDSIDDVDGWTEGSASGEFSPASIPDSPRRKGFDPFKAKMPATVKKVDFALSGPSPALRSQRSQ